MDLPFELSDIGLRGQSALGLVAFVFIASIT